MNALSFYISLFHLAALTFLAQKTTGFLFDQASIPSNAFVFQGKMANPGRKNADMGGIGMPLRRMDALFSPGCRFLQGLRKEPEHLVMEGKEMKIASSNVQAQSEHVLEKKSVTMERLNFWTGAPPEEAGQEEQAVLVQLGAAQKQKLSFMDSSMAFGVKRGRDKGDEQTDVRLRLLEAVVFALTGKRLKLRAVDTDMFSREESAGGNFPGTEAMTDWGLEYDFFRSYEEHEQIRFSASGSVQTADGRAISFSLDLHMSRSYYEESHVSLRLGNAQRMDPLVIAYAGKAPALSTQKHAFDLDADGKKEHISFGVGGSGFLAFDKNGDGRINDGSELFGPQSGNGFMELRAYDVDNNGWIDESDPVFHKLSILTMGEDGNTMLFSLGEVGVGAIYLNGIKTEYSFADGQKNDGQMRASSVFLRENGTAGSIHHIDLTI